MIKVRLRYPLDAQVKVKTVFCDGLLRPREFVLITLESKDPSAPNVFVTVLSHPFLLRLRLWLGLWRAIRKYRKIKDFYDLQSA